VRKYDFDGTVLWTHQFGTDGHDTAFGMAAHSTGLYVTGRVGLGGEHPYLLESSSAGGFDAFVLKLNRFTGEESWHSQFGSNGNDLARSVVVDATGVYVSGDANGLLNVPGASAAGGTDAFLRKFDQSGATLWIT